MKYIKNFTKYSLNEGYYDDPDFEGKTMVSNCDGFSEDDKIVKKSDKDSVGTIHHIWKGKDGKAIFVCKINGGLQKLSSEEISKV